jgi:biotin carboxyl carrier protein
MQIELSLRGELICVSLEAAESGMAARVGDRPVAATLIRLLPDGALVSLRGRTQRAFTARGDGKVWVHIDGAVLEFDEAGAQDEALPGSAHGAGGDSVVSAMPGLLVKVLVEVGQEVERGEPLVIVEAMKMETPLPSPVAGRVKKVNYAKGQIVEAGKPIVELEPRGAEQPQAEAPGRAPGA